MSDAKRGKKIIFSEEHRKHLGDANRGEKSYWFNKTKAKHPAWKDGRFKNPEGYILIYHPDDRYKRKYVVEHRVIMENHLGRQLYPWEIIHHINGIKDDNRIENLELLPNNTQYNKKIQEVYLENQRLKQEIIEYKIPVNELFAC